MGDGGSAWWGRLAAAGVAAASLSACVSSDMGGRSGGLGPRYDTREQAAPRPQPPRSPNPAQGYRTEKVGKPYQVNGAWYTPQFQPDYDETGKASWYGEAHQLKPTASGEPFDMYAPSAAHKTLPLQSLVEVVNLDNGRRIQVRINDRGPFVEGRIIDLSREAAEQLDMVRAGVARVRVRYIGPAPLDPQPRTVYARAPDVPH